MFAPSSSYLNARTPTPPTPQPRRAKTPTPPRAKTPSVKHSSPVSDTLTKTSLHNYMRSVEKNILKQLADNVTKDDLNNYMRSVEKAIIRRFDDNVTKDDLHKYMQTVEKTIIKRIDNTVTKDDINNYMSSMEKTLVKKLADNVTKDDLNNYMHSVEKNLLATSKRANEAVLDAIKECDKKHADLISDLRSEIIHLQHVKQRPPIVMTHKRRSRTRPIFTTAVATATSANKSPSPQLPEATVVCGKGKKCPPGLRCNKRTKTCRRK